MRPTFLGFETQRRTLTMAQKNLDITGNNISNINTPGYTRQRVDMYSDYVFGTMSPSYNTKSSTLAMAGQGVNAYGVAQMRNVYIDKRYRENVAIEADSSKNIEILTDMEDILDNFDTDGLQYRTQQFFDALQDYAGERPDSADTAKIVVNSANNLCKFLNLASIELKQVETTYVNELKDTCDYINELTTKMTMLNKKIEQEKFHYPREYGPNELYDQMNLYIDELATYGNITVHQDTETGVYSVTLGGVNIVDGEKFRNNRILMKEYEGYNQAYLYFESGEDVVPGSGYLNSYINMINGNGVYATGHQNATHGIPYFQTALDEFARTIAKTFNTANGDEFAPERKMFVQNDDAETLTAGNICISQSWEEDPTMIGKVRLMNESTGIPYYGYDEKLDEETGVVNLQNSNVNFLLSQFDNHNIEFGNAHDFSGSIYEYISFVTIRLGQDIEFETSKNETAETTVDGLLDTRDSLSGVQMDEEGINMMNYTKWYNASSRLLTALDDCLDKLINGTGRVGL